MIVLMIPREMGGDTGAKMNNKDIQKQTELFLDIICRNEHVRDVLERAPLLGLAQYYIGAGCLVQTVWNVISYYDINHGIKDIDIVYYDST